MGWREVEIDGFDLFGGVGGWGYLSWSILRGVKGSSRGFD